jgi:hypothetical protein
VFGGQLPHGGEFLVGGGDTDLDRGDLAEPAVVFGLLEAVEEVGVDLFQAGHLVGVRPKLRASQTPLTETVRDVRGVSRCQNGA